MHAIALLAFASGKKRGPRLSESEPFDFELFNLELLNLSSKEEL